MTTSSYQTEYIPLQPGKYASSQDVDRDWQPQKPLRKPRGIFRPRYIWPFMILIGQSIILFGTWIFYSISRDQPQPLSDSLAAAAKKSPQPYTFLVTLISTVISITSSFLFSYAIRYTLGMALSQPISLFAISSSIKVAGKFPINNFVKPWWTLGALVFMLAATSQTAGLATLLTPRPIKLTAPMSGFGVDFTNSDFAALAERYLSNWIPSSSASDTLFHLGPLIEISGISGLNSVQGLPSILNFNHLAFLNMTGGIMPGYLTSVEGAIISSQIPQNVFIVGPPPNQPPGFPTNYTLTQQGFTVDVRCQAAGVGSLPSLNITVGERGDGDIVKVSSSVNCPNNTKSITPGDLFGVMGQTTKNPPVLVFGHCFGEETMDYVFSGLGLYDNFKDTICSIAPYVSLVDVDYFTSDSLLSGGDGEATFVDVREPRNITLAPGIGQALSLVFDRSFYFGQSLHSNAIGDVLGGINTTENGEAVNRALEAYIKGVYEFSATLLRQAVEESGNELLNEDSTIPERMRSEVRGTFVSTTIGWHQTAAAIVPTTLISPTLITSISILLTLWALFRMKPRVDDQDYFDPSNILHVMAAASAGGLPDTFPPFTAEEEDYLRYGQTVSVQLDHVGTSGRIGFVQYNNDRI